ncbi:MAG TPA: hypothetical protein EYP80_02005, partial [Candidatus Aenigmarchaeota archaeon]|nr:hypothetical protein [Candidatus Aenigmarchaeota archaeon]
LFGDPSLQVRTDTPTNMTVEHDAFITIGSTSFEVVVGIEDALCAISHNGELLGYAYTDENGNAIIQFEPMEDVGTVDLVVTAYNKIPYITTIEVIPPIRQPAEFEPMEGVLIRYPFGISYDIIAEMAEDVEVVTIVASESEKTYVESQYQSHGINLSHCSFLIAPTDTYWTRDYGPWFVFNGTTGKIDVINFTYNRPRPNDDRIPEIYANNQSMNLHYMPLVHSGGNYMTDGHRIAVSTDLVLDENPDLTQEEIEEIVKNYLGITTYHIVPDVLGEYIKHIDCWAKFLAPDKIMIIEVPPSHPQYDEIEAAVDYFANQLSCYGTPYKIYRVYTPNGEPYINSLILNDKVLVPIVESEWDDDALASYQSAMPGYEILGFTGSWLTTDALHCRVKGIPDRYMLYIEHIPLKDQLPSDNGFLVEAKIIPYSGESLVNDTPVVYWKNSSIGWNMVQMQYKGGNVYYAYIPPQPCGETIYYYIHAEDASGRSENHPYIGAADPHSFEVTPVPDIWVSPFSFDLVASEGHIIYENLTIGNSVYAGKNLSINISCNGEGWLSFSILNATIEPASYINVTLIINTTGMSIGIYHESISIWSNDPDEPLLIIPVNLSIVYENDVGVLSINFPTYAPPGL